MNVFTTKDRKVYKVSLKNFVAATNKKSPYYKRVKIKGKIVEKAYAICPACGNPVHFVNLFNRSKKKKAHVRHQRSSIRNLAKYNALAYENCPFVKGEVDDVGVRKKNEKIQSVTKPFCDAIVNAFGFTEKSANLLVKIYLKLREDDPETANQKFFAYMASASYNDISLIDLFKKFNGGTIKKFGMGQAWNAVGEVNLDETVVNDLISLGFGSEMINSLFKELRDQHDSLDDATTPYYRKPDFTHLCATAATILSESVWKTVGSVTAGGFNSVFSTDDNTGYIGDVCGTDGTEPSMNDGDYKADLDAVNVTTRLQKNDKTSSLLTVIADYYNGIDSGEINRACEFKDNVGLSTLRVQRADYYSLLAQKLLSFNQKDGIFLSSDNLESQDELKATISVFDSFIEHIAQEKREWQDE